MKSSDYFNIFLIVLFLFLAQMTYSHNGKRAKLADTALCLEIKGKLPKMRQGSSSTYTVELIEWNTVIETKTVKAGGSFKFLFRENECYAIRITEEGCTPKLISVFTDVPHGHDYFYQLCFTADDLISDTEASQLDTDALEFPCAIFEYDKKREEFVYNKEYAKNIRKKVCVPILADKARTLPQR